MSALLEYECRVCVDGYEVVEEAIDPEDLRKYRRVLQLTPEMVLQPRSKRTRRFDLFEVNSSAFLEFAQMPATEDAIKDFAGRYGLLSHPGETIVGWSVNIQEMHRTVTVWETSIRTGDFSKIIRAVEKLVGVRAIGEGLSVALVLTKDPLSASPSLCIRPINLQFALKAQLLLAIDGNLNLRGCVQCRKWFTLEAGRGRSDKEYCSNACRMRAYRKRKVSE
jgi:hypothetical protein